MQLEGMKVSYSYAGLTPEHFSKEIEALLTTARAVYDAVGSLSDSDVTYDSVIKPIAAIENDLYTYGSQLFMPHFIGAEKSLRDASTEAEKKYQEFEVETSMRKDVFDKFVHFQDNCMDSKQLTAEGKRYVERKIKLGKRNGLHLSKELQEKITDVQKRLSNLSVEFGRNLNEENCHLHFSEDELAGVPQDFLESLEQNSEGKRKVTLKYPHFFPVSKQCQIPETRKQLETAFQSRCMDVNTTILEEVVKLRGELAQLLGYENFAAYALEMTMAKKPETVAKFLSNLANQLQPLWKNEHEMMLKLKKEECAELGEEFDGELNFWDVRYYSEMVTKKQYSVDNHKLKEYFPLETVKKGLLEIYQELLGLKFTEVPDADKWHDDVQLYKVNDVSSGTLLGYFFLDLFPREGKYGHACVRALQRGCLDADRNRQVCVVVMATNFSMPVKDKPALLDHDEVECFFHEFGHVMHQLCSQTEFALFSGTRVEMDFVEAPSQMLENWVFEREPLRRMSAHYKDGSPLPDEMLDNLIKSRKANAGIVNLRQVALGTFDQRLHTSSEKKVHTEALFAETYKKITGLKPIPNTNMPANFGHIGKGYAAKYYGYLWSEVYSMDMYAARFKKDGIMNPMVGMDYRHCILQPGGSQDAADTLKNFLGRDPTPDAFLASKGLSVGDQ